MVGETQKPPPNDTKPTEKMKHEFNVFRAFPAFILIASLVFAMSPIGAGNGNSGSQATGDTSVGLVMLGAPGVGLDYRSVNQSTFAETANIGRYYKFVFTGIEAQADADGVPGSYPWDGHMWDGPKPKSNNGHGNNCDGVDSSNPGKSKQGLDSDPTVDDECKGKKGTSDGTTTTTSGSNPTHVNGWWEMWAQVNNTSINKLSYSTPELHDISGVMRRYLNSPITFREQNITLSWFGNGNSKDPDGHFYILGSAIKEPPVPIGKLDIVQKVYSGGTKPPFEWEINRE